MSYPGPGMYFFPVRADIAMPIIRAGSILLHPGRVRGRYGP